MAVDQITPGRQSRKRAAVSGSFFDSLPIRQRGIVCRLTLEHETWKGKSKKRSSGQFPCGCFSWQARCIER